jgi:hypothetical protein
MRSLFALLAFCAISVNAVFAEEFVPPKTHPDSASWDDMIAPDLSNAVYPKGIWSVKDGVLTATEDQNIWTKAVYENCVIDLEFKNAKGSNSGVFVYCTDIKNSIPNSVEVQILDDYAAKWASVAPTWKCGAFFGHKPADKQVVKKAGEWNRMTITCKGPMIYVLLNGEPINEIDLRKWTNAKKNPDGTDIPSWLSRAWSELPQKGQIGLQGKHGDAPIYFRNLKIKKID